MRIEINIKRKHIFIFMFSFLAIAGLFVVVAYGTNSPPVFGHTASEIGPGDTWQRSIDGSATFGGNENHWYWIRGHLGLGNNHTDTDTNSYTRMQNRDLHIKVAGRPPRLALEGSGLNYNGSSFIEFIRDGSLRANMYWNQTNIFGGYGHLSINDVGTDTIININGGNVIIGNASSRVTVPGQLCLSTNANACGTPDLHIKVAGRPPRLALEGSGLNYNGSSFIEFIRDGSLRANMYWNQTNIFGGYGHLSINDVGTDTIININGGNVIIGNASSRVTVPGQLCLSTNANACGTPQPETMVARNVSAKTVSTQNITANRICFGSDCRTDWPSTSPTVTLMHAQAFRKSQTTPPVRPIIVVSGPTEAFIELNQIGAHPNSYWANITTSNIYGISCNSTLGWRLAGCWRVGGANQPVFPYNNGCLTTFTPGENIEISITCIKLS